MKYGEQFQLFNEDAEDPRQRSALDLAAELCSRGGTRNYYVAGLNYTNSWDGHFDVVTRIDPSDSELSATIRFWDPDDGGHGGWYTQNLGFFRSSGNEVGPWVIYFGTHDYAGSLVSVADIQDFGVAQSTPGGHDITLKAKVQYIQNGHLGVYVSDNALGPAELIGDLVVPSVAVPDSNVWTDDLRLPASSDYFYWLDYEDTYGFDQTRSPVGLYQATGNPVHVDGGEASFAPPWITSVTDEPFDRGGSVIVEWAAPTGIEDADRFNVYRHSYPEGQPGASDWIVVNWLNTSSRSYLDNGVAPGFVNDYRISIGHHGNNVIQSGDGNTGIWNTFSAPASGKAVDNIALHTITSACPDTVLVCPGGDVDSLYFLETIKGNDGVPTVGIPPEMLVCYVQADSVGACDGDTLLVDGPTDETGLTKLSEAHIGGHGRANLIFAAALDVGATLLDTITVYVKSADENGDGHVGPGDYTAFLSSWTSPPHTYIWYRDYNGNGDIGAGDFTHFVSHLYHQCGSSSSSPESYVASDAKVKLRFSEVVSAASSRLFYADVSIVDAPARFSAMLMCLRSDNPSLDFVEWEAGTNDKVIVAPVVRNGVKEMALGVVGKPDYNSSVVDLGRLVYSVSSNSPVELSETDFETRVGLVITSTSVASLGGNAFSSERKVNHIVLDELAQNYPNPFNPATTIAFSVEDAGPVSLAIYDVAGRRVRQLVNEWRTPGAYQVEWNGRTDRGAPVASGIYFYRLVTGSFSDTKKMMILK